MELIILFWIICGLIAGYIYSGKGRSYALGCIAGFLLGPIGIVLALVSGTNEAGVAQAQKKHEEAAIARGEMKRCRHCFEPIRIDAKVCRYCQRDVA